ncbi:hypothetical protein FF1_031869 [Malus domestica]
MEFKAVDYCLYSPIEWCREEEESNYYEHGLKQAYKEENFKKFLARSNQLDHSCTQLKSNSSSEKHEARRSFEWLQTIKCLAHVHVYDSKRIKLDDKSKNCILLGVSEESKAYHLFNPASKKIVISRDVIFEEDKAWD